MTQAFCEEISKSHANNYFVEADAFEFGDPFFANFTAVTLSEDDRKALATALDKDNSMTSANDRYFSKTSFNTQGIGLVFQREFERLFPTRKRKHHAPAQTTPSDSINKQH